MTGFQSKRAMAQDRFDVVDLGMYTDEGNRIAEMLCDSAVLFGWTWPVLYANMRRVAEASPEICGELMDTAVREAMYDRCKFTTNFYV
jgi:hypothetical protein